MAVIKETPSGVIINVRVLPRSSRSQMAGMQDDALRIKLAAPPVEGKANEELIKFLASAFKIKRAQISITSGDKSKHKTVAIEGVKPGDIEPLLPRTSD